MEDYDFIDETKFQIKIEELVIEKKINHLEAVLFFCEEEDVDFDAMVKYLSVNLKEKIRVAAMEMGYFKKESSLEIL